MIEKMHRFGVLRSILWGLFGFILCIFAVTSGLHAGEKPLFTASELPIVTDQRAITVSVEVASTHRARIQGLQGRRHLAAKSGMLFDFIKPQIISMWMKNTYISLDMIFIGADGRILHIAENTEPFSLKSILSPVPARAVLEMKAGSADRYGIEPGHRVEHPIFVKKRR